MPKAKPPQAGEFPFNIGTTQAARALIRIHQFLRGELLKSQDGEAVMVEPVSSIQHMRDIEAVLAFLRIDFDPKKLKPRRARPKTGPLGYGEVRAGVLDALKRAKDWQSYNQLADAVLRQHDIELTPAQHKHFLQKLREGTQALKQAGAVICEHRLALGETAIQQRWRLSPMFD
jgi:hypothetical protein